MRILCIQEAFKRKFERQSGIRPLEYHASGHCVHIGKLSPGCYKCFVPDEFSTNIMAGVKCNLNCPYCPVKKENKSPFPDHFFENLKARLYRKVLTADVSNTIPSIAFSGEGEPLMHLDVITDMMNFLRDIEGHMKKRPWYYLYTNGTFADLDTVLLLKDLGFDEIRFHIGASNFSKGVYKNMANAVPHFKAITVETPAWPPHRKKLFEMLPIIEDIGVRYLNIGETEITIHNYEKISKILPNGEIYQCYGINLYDDGLVYDIMEEILRKKYSYSVLDCGCFAKSIQRAPGKWVYFEDVNGLCAEYKP
jgi:pyruvate formate-lyase activating enzyme-like uncharacterized protein